MDTVLIDKEMLLEVKTSNLHLSIEASARGFGFALYDLHNSRYVGVGYRNFGTAVDGIALAERLHDEFAKNNLAQTGFTKSSLVWVSPDATLVPEALYDEKQAAAYYALNCEPVDESSLYTEKIKGLGAYTIFSLPKEVEDFCAAHLKNPAIMHHSKVLMESLLLNESTVKNGVYVHVQASHFDIIILDHGQLKLYNYYSYTSAEDFAYHILNTCKQQGLNPQGLTVTLLGEIEAESALSDILRKYIYRVDYYQPQAGYSLSLELGKLPHHFYFNLFNQQACV